MQARLTARALAELSRVARRRGAASHARAPAPATSAPGRRLGDRRGQQLGDAGIAPVVHVQAVGREEGLERHVLASRASSASRRSGGTGRRSSALAAVRDQIDHALGVGLGDAPSGANCGSISTTSAPVALSAATPSTDQRARRERMCRAAPNWCRPARARDRASRRSRRVEAAPACRRASSPLTPRLSTVIVRGREMRSCSSTASRLG